MSSSCLCRAVSEPLFFISIHSLFFFQTYLLLLTCLFLRIQYNLYNMEALPDCICCYRNRWFHLHSSPVVKLSKWRKQLQNRTDYSFQVHFEHTKLREMNQQDVATEGKNQIWRQLQWASSIVSLNKLDIEIWLLLSLLFLKLFLTRK